MMTAQRPNPPTNERVDPGDEYRELQKVLDEIENGLEMVRSLARRMKHQDD